MSARTYQYGRGRDMRWVRLTRQQKTALLWLQREVGTEHWALGYFLYDEGVRPCPTFDNLAHKGLVERGAYEELSDDECGYLWRLTPAGLEVAEQLVAEAAR